MDSPHPRRPSPPPPWTRVALLVACGTVVLAQAWWVRTLEPWAGITAAAAALTGGIVAWAVRRRRTAIALVVAGLGAAAATGTHERDRLVLVAATADAPDSVRRAVAARFRTSVELLQAELTGAAASVAGGTRAADAVSSLAAGSGLAVFEEDRAVEWAGTTVIRTETLWERAGVVTTPFDVVQYAVAVRDGRRAVATAVLATSPPADRLRSSLAEAIGRREGVAFEIGATVNPDAAPDADALIRIGGMHVTVNVRPRSIEARHVELQEAARVRGSLVLAFAALAVLLSLWRHGAWVFERLGAIAIPAAAIAVTPINSLSNVSRLFDPATYYAPIGGPFTSSAGALTISSALALFAVLAVLRSRALPQLRWAAAVGVILIAVATPYLLRELARGVTLPPRGMTTAIWLSWEVALFLAATTVVAAGVWAGQQVLGRARGFPLWLAPVIGAIGALMGPLLLGDFARWPGWYAAIWIGAVAALALARRSRAILFPSAFVAACGATTLLWGVTLRERISLANADVATLSAVDPGAALLLDRFSYELIRAPVARDRAQLLARYAASDLAAIQPPIVLAHWAPGAPPTVLSLGGPARLPEVEPIIAEARATGHPITRELRATPAAARVLVVPHGRGEVTSVVLGARSQLTPAPMFAELLGLEEPPARRAYTLSLTGPAAPGDPDVTPWVRRGAHLHADWTMAIVGGDPVRLHASVPFDLYDALVPRGMLVVLFDMLIVGVLWAVYRLADGVLVRWLRRQRRALAGSYRLRLGVVLFAFFVVPALVFGLWSYRRLQADDRAARELLVRETLRRAAVNDTGPTPIVEHVPPDIPLFVYRGGQLIDTSDSLMLAVAPVGLFLDGRVRDALAAREELVAAAPISVGDGELLFGFRSLLPGLVAAVPARRDDATIDQRRSDLGVLVVLATVLGGFAALALSGIVARQLARPIGTLQRGALAVAGGSRAPLQVSDAPSEFVPVFRAFDQMARDLAASEAQLTRAERVFAWGEMARQVAHEIKNPLTPIRLGVQHLRRAWLDKHPDFGTILEENAERLLNEIDHLDSTARSFSRFGTPNPTQDPLEVVDAAAVVRDVASFEAIGADGLEWRAIGTQGPRWVRSRAGELREVLLNLCENSRLAGARRVEIRVEEVDSVVRVSVRDDGAGIAPELTGRVFEPHFSTRTSGSGLGLAISRRLVEGWGGGIELESEIGVGTAVHLRLVRASPPTPTGSPPGETEPSPQ